MRINSINTRNQISQQSNNQQTLLNRQQQLNSSKQSVNREIEYRYPLLFPKTLFEILGQQKTEQEHFPVLTTFFYKKFVGQIKYDLKKKLSTEIELKKLIDRLNKYLEIIQNLLSEDSLGCHKLTILHRFASRFTIAKAYISNKWDEAASHFEISSPSQINSEQLWYKNICLLFKFQSPTCESITNKEAEYWMGQIELLPDNCYKTPMKFIFLSVYKKKSSSFPDYTFINKHFAGILQPIEIEGEFSQFANEFIKKSLDNEIMNSLDNIFSTLNHSKNGKKRLQVSFLENDLCLGEQLDPFLFDVSNYGKGSSFQAFFAQFALPQFCLQLPNNFPNEQNANTFQERFFEELRKRGWMNSTEGLLPDLDENIITEIFCQTLEQFNIDKPRLDHIKESFLKQVEQGKECYKQKLDFLSGFVQHEAIAIFIRSLKSDERGINDLKLHRDIIKSLKSCLQLHLKSIDISKMDKDNQASEWDIISESVLNYLRNGKPVLLSCGSPLDNETSQSSHGIYVAIRHIDRNHVNFFIINGGEACLEFHSEYKMKTSEIPYYYYKKSDKLNLKTDKETLKMFIKIVLSFPHSCGDWSNLYKNKKVPLKDHHKFFPLQLMGSCAIHNLKYGLKVLFAFNEKKMGDMMRSYLIGIDEISKSQIGDVTNENPLPLNENYTKISPVYRKLKIKNKTFGNFDNAFKNEGFKDAITSLYNKYTQEKVIKFAKDLFSSNDSNSDFDGIDRFLIELKYDLENKNEQTKQPVYTLQELYMTFYGWKFNYKSETNSQLKLYRTMEKKEYENLNENEALSGHLGDFKQALHYLFADPKNKGKKVMVEFTLKKDSEKELFSKNLAFPKITNPKTEDKIETIKKKINADSPHPQCSKNEGKSDEYIGIKSEKHGEAGFSICIGGKKVSKKFMTLVDSFRAVDIILDPKESLFKTKVFSNDLNN